MKKDRPLDLGNVLRSTVVHDERGDFSRSFNPDRLTMVYEEKVMREVESGLSSCKDCPYAKIDIYRDISHIDLKKRITATAFCEATREYKSHCPVDHSKDLHLSDPLITGTPMPPDWISESFKEAFKTGGSFTTVSTDDTSVINPRRAGKSILGKAIKEVFTDDLTEPLELIDDDLEEAVEFETSRQNYDNFGSW